MSNLRRTIQRNKVRRLMGGKSRAMSRFWHYRKAVKK